MSRNIATIGIAVAIAVSFLFVGVGAVAAHDGGNDVGASGHCSDEAGNGGGASVGVSDDGEPSQDDVDAFDADEIQSLVAGLQEFGEEKQDHPDRADTCDGGAPDGGDDSYDYLEAHAGPVQFCYSEDNSDASPPGGVGADGDQCH